MIDLLIVNYNLPEAVDTIVNSIVSDVPHRWIVVDNGSTIPAHPKTNVVVKTNDKWMSGLRAGLEQVTSEFVWIFTTSMGAVHCEGDPIQEMQSTFTNLVVGVFPGFTGIAKEKPHAHLSSCEWHYKEVFLGGPEGMWRTDWLKQHIDYRMKYGWGIDFELGYLARKEGRALVLNSHVTVELKEHNGYPDRRPESLDTVNMDATRNMDAVLSEKYGADWYTLFGLKEILHA